jgi:hypothetical protein
VLGGLVLGGLALVTAVAFWAHLLGAQGVVIAAGTCAALLGAMLLLPDGTWRRLAQINTLADDLGELHAEGAVLRSELPWVADDDPGQVLAEWTSRCNFWDERVQKRLGGSRWLGTYLSPAPGAKITTDGYAVASRYRNALDDRLERLSQILRALGRGS